MIACAQHLLSMNSACAQLLNSLDWQRRTEQYVQSCLNTNSKKSENDLQNMFRADSPCDITGIRTEKKAMPYAKRDMMYVKRHMQSPF